MKLLHEKNSLGQFVVCYLNKHAGIWLSICFLLVFQPSPIFAASFNDKLTLTEAIKRSLEQNPSHKAFALRAAALQGQLETAQLNPAYRLDIETENFAGTKNFTGLDSVELTVSLSSIIEMGGKREARTGFYSNKHSVLVAQKQAESLELLGEVTRRYIDVLAAQERVILASEATELAKSTLVVVKKRAQVGSTPEAEVKRAKAALSQAELSLLSEQQQLAYLKVALAALWGDPKPQFAAVLGDLFLFGEDVGFDLLYAKLERNPAIQVFAAEERLRDAEVRLAKTESSNDFRWSVGVRRLQETNDTALIAGFSMPLFSSSRNKGAIASALAYRNEVFVQREVALLNMHTQLFRAFNNRQQAITSVNKLQNEIVPALKQALQETRQAYERGRYSYLDYVTARQELLSARRSLIQAAAAALTYGANIEQLTAEPLPASQH